MWVAVDNKVRLDCMFFPSLKNTVKSPRQVILDSDRKEYSTVIRNQPSIIVMGGNAFYY